MESSPGPTDAEVLAASITDPEQFGALFDRHYASIHHFIARRLGTEQADDLAAETFARAFNARSSFDPSRGEPRPWIYGIASNIIKMHARSDERRLRAYARVPTEIAEDFSDLATDRASAEALGLALTNVVMELSPDDREVLLLHVWADLSLSEVAFALGTPEGTVRSRLSRSRKRLQESLGQWADGDRVLAITEEAQHDHR